MLYNPAAATITPAATAAITPVACEPTPAAAATITPARPQLTRPAPLAELQLASDAGSDSDKATAMADEIKACEYQVRFAGRIEHDAASATERSGEDFNGRMRLGDAFGTRLIPNCRPCLTMPPRDGSRQVRIDEAIAKSAGAVHDGTGSVEDRGPGGEAGPYQVMVVPHGWVTSDAERHRVRMPEDACTQHVGDNEPVVLCRNPENYYSR